MSPVQRFHLIRKHDTGEIGTAAKSDFERVALDARRYRTHERKRRLRVVRRCREYERRPLSALLAAGLGIKIDPNDVPDVGNVLRAYQASLPSAAPVDTSPCRF